MRERDCLEEPGIDGMIILKIILERNPVGREWTGILSTARSINSAEVLRDVTSSLVDESESLSKQVEDTSNNLL